MRGRISFRPLHAGILIVCLACACRAQTSQPSNLDQVRAEIAKLRADYESQKFTIQYGDGAAANFSTTPFEPNYLWRKPRTVLVTDHLLLQPESAFAVMPSFVFRTTKAEGLKSELQWVPFGAQPVWYYHPHLSLAFDAGFDWVSVPDPAKTYSGWVRKFTIAQQIGTKPESSPGRYYACS